MPQAYNHVRWCLNKAKKEIAEGKKHRGLVEIKPDLELAVSHLGKAEHNFKAISYFHKGGFSDWSASAAFYTIYHCFLAILAKQGYESRNQECTISAILYLKAQGKVKMGNKFIMALQHQEEFKEIHEHNVIDLREDYQYGVKKEIEEKDKIKKLLEICKEAIDITKEEIYTES
ncbi:MAG: HEPN domain-containing protein [Nanoarchaeota archaeon]|nr:HEPN domain-containing protein [Nanoarchaeota archaeon]